MDSNAPRWSSDVHQADWIGPRLAPWEGDSYPVTIAVPAGFAAYARVLHPAAVPDHRENLIRWADVATWSGLPLRPDAQFHSVALPLTDPGGPPPYRGQGPRDGSLYVRDAEVLAGILRDWTATPDDCWFCVWDGYGWVSDLVSEGPRVQLPHRSYALYQGPAEAAATLAGLDGAFGHTPNLWWPADHGWCAASEIDLPWTYVGGPRGLIDAILADHRIEALPAAPDDRVSRVEDWVAAWVDTLAEELLARDTASLSTPRGSVTARLRRPRGARDGDLKIEVTGRDGDASISWARLDGSGAGLGSSVHLHLTLAVLSLTAC